jgi:hypothetical protein
MLKTSIIRITANDENLEVIMQNPTHDKKPGDKKPAEVAKKAKPDSVRTDQRPKVKDSDQQPQKK